MSSDWLNIAKSKLTGFGKELGKFMGKSTIEGIGAAIAFVAIANGEVKQSEKDAFIREITSSDSLSGWAPDIVKAFERYIEILSTESALLSETTIIDAVQKIPKDSLPASTAIAVCISVAGADGDFDNLEKKRVVRLSRLLNVDLSIFSLTVSGDTILTERTTTAPLTERTTIAAPSTERTTTTPDFTAKITLQKGQVASFSTDKFSVKFIWAAAVALKLVIFYKAKNGQTGALFTNPIPNGTKGNLSQFPFIEFTKVDSGGNVEEISIAKLSELQQIYLCALDSSKISSAEKTNFAACGAGIVVSDDTGESAAIPLKATEQGDIAVICRIDSSPVSKKVTSENQILDFGVLRQKIPGASGFLK